MELIRAFLPSKWKYTVDTDISIIGLVAVLSQVQNGKEQVIAYYSKGFPKHREIIVLQRESLFQVGNIFVVEQYN